MIESPDTYTESQSFIRAILENPLNDELRLIYADWLGDHDQDSRSEFIRIQLEVSALLNGPISSDAQSSLKYDALRRRELELFSQGMSSWVYKSMVGFPGKFVPAIDRPGRDAPHAFYHRGFIERVQCPLMTWMIHGVGIYGNHPIQWVECSDKNPRTAIEERYNYQSVVINNGELYGWVDEASRESVNIQWTRENILPQRVFKLLVKDRKPYNANVDLGTRNLGYIYYDKVEAAVADLSQALIQLAGGS